MNVKTICRSLRACGYEVIFGIPGTGPTLDLLSEFSSLGGEVVITTHEASSVVMAGHYHEITGRNAAVVASNGISRLNVLAGMMHLRFESQEAVAFFDDYSELASPDMRLQRLPSLNFESVFSVYEHVAVSKKNDMTSPEETFTIKGNAAYGLYFE